MIICDEWLLDLGVESPQARMVARLCLEVQISAFRERQHVLALNDTLTRENIKRAAARGMIPHTIVRCMRCGAQAWFLDWVASADLLLSALDRGAIPYKRQAQTGDLDFLYRCNGDSNAEGLMAILGLKG
jgi:hypothetical protein